MIKLTKRGPAKGQGGRPKSEPKVTLQLRVSAKVAALMPSKKEVAKFLESHDWKVTIGRSVSTTRSKRHKSL